MPKNKSASDVPEITVAGIGASAGGLEAIQEFFDNLPSISEICFVVIQHLSADHKSLLVELVSRHTSLMVTEAAHDHVIEAGRVYIIPNNKVLTIKSSRLMLSDKSTVKGPNTAIDQFFESLAADQRRKSIAIILSGTGTDGSKGIMAVQEAGGMVVVQEPSSAKFDGMPNSAIATGCADYIAAPGEIPDIILSYLSDNPKFVDNGSPDPSLLPEVFKLIHKNCGYDFNNYKSSTILRRISRRMGMLGFLRFRDYLNLLHTSPEECKFLGQEFLIGVTQFFRDIEAFRYLKRDVLEPLVRQKEPNDLLKIWVTACSTGEEVYSLAMLLDDILRKHGKNLEVKIFATDIDANAIEFAAKATYPVSSLRFVAPDYCAEYFIEENGVAKILPRIRRQIVFATHNVLKDPPFIKNDLVSCRNMLIYFNAELQQKAISNFRFALKKDGFLFLGPSEVLIEREGFEEVNSKWKFFRKVIDGPRFRADKSAPFPEFQYDIPMLRRREKQPDRGSDLAQKFSNLLVERHGYTALYVDDNFEIKDAIGDLNRYFNLPQQFGNLNILKMIKRGAATSLSAGIRKAKKEKKEVVVSNVRMSEEKAVEFYLDPTAHKQLLLVIIRELEGIPTPNDREIVASHEVGTNLLQELEDDLRETRYELQLAVENSETANEELQSSNEELLSANEELQSSNEELQSLNEELHTLNTEHQARIKDLTELNDDLDNFFKSSHVAQVFLDKEMKIRKFNPLAMKMINIIEEDVGRPIAHLSTNIHNDRDFLQELHEVLRTGRVLEREVQMSDGNIYLMRIFPFIRNDRQVDGTVITFIDVTERKELNTIVKSVFDATPSAIMAYKCIVGDGKQAQDFEKVATNRYADRLLQLYARSKRSHRLSDLIPAFFSEEFFARLQEVVETQKPFRAELRVTSEQNSVQWFDAIVIPMIAGIVINLINTTEKKEQDEKFQSNYKELIKVKENFGTLNSELELKVAQRTSELKLTEERFRLISGITSDAIWDRNLSNGKMWWSDSFFARFGFDSRTCPRTFEQYREFIHPEDIEGLEKFISRSLEHGLPWTATYRVKHKVTRQYLRVRETGLVLFNEAKEPYRLIGAITDLSPKEIAQENKFLKETKAELEGLVNKRTSQLETQKQVLYNLFMQAPALVCTLKGEAHTFDLVNPNLQNFFGRRNLNGISLTEALPDFHSTGLTSILDEVYKTRKPFEGKEMRFVIDRQQGAGPQEVFFNFNFQPYFDEDKNVQGIIVFAFDVTDQILSRTAIQSANEELQRLVQEFQFVTDFMPQIVWSTMQDGSHYFFNRRWFEYTALTYEESMRDGWINILHSDDRQKSLAIWQQALSNGSPYEVEYRLKRHDGEYHWFLARALPIKGDDGKIRKWFGTCTDINEQKLANETLEQKVQERTSELSQINQELETTNADLLQYASIASHDLKEPLRKIVIFGNLLKEHHRDELSEKAFSYLQKITYSSERMSRLVSDLLTYTRSSVSANKFVRCDLTKLVQDVLNDLEIEISEKGAEVEVESLMEAEVLEIEFRQVFQNLISNALKFSRPGVVPRIGIRGVKVSQLTAVDAYDKNGSYCRITIEDNGIGFNNNYAEKIFGMFQRLHGQYQFDGTGIGLAIAKKVVLKHNGMIIATGVENQGAKFTIVIPERQSALQTTADGMSLMPPMAS